MRKNMREIKRKKGGETGKGKREGKERNGKGTGRDTGSNYERLGSIMVWGLEEMKG